MPVVTYPRGVVEDHHVSDVAVVANRVVFEAPVEKRESVDVGLGPLGLADLHEEHVLRS